MDFSSISRALESLHRRQPPLPQPILTVSNELQGLLFAVVPPDDDGTTTDNSRTTNEEVLRLLEALMITSQNDNDSTTSRRWEPLAVGLYVATELLMMMTKQEQPPPSSSSSSSSVTAITSTASSTMPTSNPVYMDGPRVPTTKLLTATTPIAVGNNNSAAVENVSTNESSSSSISNNRVVVLSSWSTTASTTATLIRMMHTVCVQHLEHSEPRLRTLVAKAVGAYASQIRHIRIRRNDAMEVNDDNENDDLQPLLQEIYTMLIQSIEHHIEVGRSSSPEESATTTTTTDPTTTERPLDGLPSTTVVDDTTGWRAIETNWLCLASLIHGCYDLYYEWFPISTELYQYCARSAIHHVNRHVRAAAMQTYEQWIHVITATILAQQGNDDGGGSSNSTTAAAKVDSLRLLFSESTSLLRMTLIDIVKAGLADNWSQVRMASSVLCRVWFTSLQTLQIPIDTEPTMLAALLPRMCLNRFYLAQGVKLYSYETWKMIFGSSSSTGDTTEVSLGLRLVVEHINAMIRYYIKMCDADNHAVREAACQAIAELAVKVGTNEQYRKAEVLDEQQIQHLIAALLMCFYDESWPVRDEACLACGILCKAFPQACYNEIFHKTLWERFTEQLTDQIWSVRENAAVAIGDVLEAYGNEILPKVQLLIKTLLPSAKEQPSMSATEYKDHVNDLNQHTDNQLYSCGSLAPKLRKGGAGRIGCTNCGIDRPKAPWEATDGCIYMIREYVIRRTVPDGIITPITDEELVPLLTELADVCRVRHFPQSDEIRATLWKCLPVIAVALGTKRFKNRYFDIFMDLLFSNLESSSASQLSIHAAGQCAEELAALIGMTLFRARLDTDHHRHLFDAMVQERQRMPKGPAGGSDIFSPFGPPGLLLVE